MSFLEFTLVFYSISISYRISYTLKNKQQIIYFGFFHTVHFLAKYLSDLALGRFDFWLFFQDSEKAVRLNSFIDNLFYSNFLSLGAKNGAFRADQHWNG